VGERLEAMDAAFIESILNKERRTGSITAAVFVRKRCLKAVGVLVLLFFVLTILKQQDPDGTVLQRVFGLALLSDWYDQLFRLLLRCMLGFGVGLALLGLVADLYVKALKLGEALDLQRHQRE